MTAENANIIDLEWALQRPVLWNAAQQTEPRNARLAREVLVLLPPELTAVQRVALARTFASDLANR